MHQSIAKNMNKKILLIALLAPIHLLRAQNIGVGTTSPQSRLSVGANSQFQVDSTGNIRKLNNVPVSFPSTQGLPNNLLVNDGSGNLNWSGGSVVNGSTILSLNYDSSILNLGYTFVGGVQLPFRNQTDSFAWAWGSNVATVNAPSARYGHSAIWTGTEMIIWGGATSSLAFTNDGNRYNPITNSWGATTSTGSNLPAARKWHSAIWTGTEMIIWGGHVNGNNNTGGRYNPSTNSWGLAVNTTFAPAGRQGQSAVWTGNEMIIWGGESGGSPTTYYNDGKKFNPVTNSWGIVISNVNAPSARSHHSTIWTGSEMIIWGGVGAANTGGRYNASTNSWGPALNTNGAPASRWGHTAVWTGSEMLVWGGYSTSASVPVATGGRFDPVKNLWYAMSTTNAPAARYHHSAVWVGNEMIVFGGWNGSGFYNDGKRFGFYYQGINAPMTTFYLYKKD